MEVLDYREEFRRFLMETCTSEMAHDASQNYSAREKEETALFLREEFRRFLMGNNPRAVMEEFLRLLMGNYPRAVKEEFCRLLMEAYDIELIEVYIRKLKSFGIHKYVLFEEATTKAEATNDLFKMVTTKAEKTNVLRQQVYELKEIFEKSMYEIKLCKKTIYKTKPCEFWEASNIADAFCQVLRFILAAIDEWLEWQLFIVLLAVLLLGNNDDCKGLVRPERGTISCITVYLLGNDGAHSYNGNGILFSKPIKYGLLTDEELVDQRRHAELPSDVLLRQPTDREQATITKDVLLRQLTDVELVKIARQIGEEYVLLAPLLGITMAELDHIREDNCTALRRIYCMLLKWRESKGSNATIEVLADKLEILGRNADIVYSSLD